jgi:hypothetical protein
MVWAVVWSARAGDTIQSVARTATATTVRLLRIMRVLPNGGWRDLVLVGSRGRQGPGECLRHGQTAISEEASAARWLNGLKAMYRAHRCEIDQESNRSS